MANTPSGVRQDKTRRVVADLETTVGSPVLNPGSPTGSEPEFPARADSRLAVSDGDLISNSEALDGLAGEVAGTRGAIGRGGTLVTEVRDYSGQNPFPAWVKQLLASGMECSHSAPNIILTPSTKAIADWPGNTAGDRSPASMTIVEVLVDNNTADELTATAGAVLKTKLILGTNGLMLVSSEIVGLLVNDVLIAVNDTDLSGFGAVPADQGAGPIVMKGATWTVNYVDDIGTTALTLARPKALEIELNANIVRVEDPTAVNGWAVAAVFWDEAPAVTLEFADAASLSEDVMAGMKSGTGFLDINVVVETNSAASRAMTVDVPRIQYDAERTNGDGARMFSISGRAVRQKNGDTTAPVTVMWDYGT